jgi:phosphatidylserine/phosphatidylglycerophosphate/cardiolipin synthase-like enzyme
VAGLHAVEEADDGGVMYYTTGSLNMNVRSMALDGEVVGIVEGPWALAPFADFLLFSGAVTWVEGLDDVERLLPPFGTFKRRLGRWLHRLL